MCGIVGVLSSTPVGPEWKARCLEALRLLRHRGPDNSELHCFEQVLLGHTRLSIVDPTIEANQPFADASGRFWIAWNGEIYNFVELRDELKSHGRQFRTLSDTEVALEAFKEWGPECQARFNGMWAMILFDTATGEILLSRDRYGIKPLYWSETGSAVLFASEMKALFPLGVPRKPNLEHVERIRRDCIGQESGEATAFVGIRSLPAGHCLRLKRGIRPSLTRWWSLEDDLCAVPRTFAGRVDRLRELFEDSIRLRVRNDVPTAVALSGGLDSSSVFGASCRLKQAGALRKASDPSKEKSIQIWSVVYPGNPIDEGYWVRACVDHWGEREHLCTVTPSAEEIPDRIEEMVWHQETPVWSPSVLAFHALYREVGASGIRVILEGHGADEMFGGYANLISTGAVNYASSLNLILAWRASCCLAEVMNLSANRPGIAKGVTFLYILAKAMCVRCGLQRQVSLAESMRIQFAERALPFFLKVFDRATMAYGVESCLPFLDYRLVGYAFSLCESDKVERWSKRILRDAAENWAPRAVTRRKGKMPFTSPIREWFNTDRVSEFLMDTLSSQKAIASSVAKVNVALKILERKRRNLNNTDIQRLWPELNLFLWERQFLTDTGR